MKKTTQKWCLRILVWLAAVLVLLGGVPEFGYESYWRLLEAEISGRSTTFQFKANPYSTYNRRTHFTPIWYPDGSYTPYTWLLDCWTPTGMLSMNLTDRVTIRGNLWEEWHIAPAKQR